MKKASIILMVLFFGITLSGMAQNATKDFFVGKWEIVILGTPNGDSKMVTELVRKDGKLTGELKDAADTSKPVIPITSIEETGAAIDLAFSASGYDVTVNLEKVDEDNLKGLLMGMFETKAKRLKQ